MNKNKKSTPNAKVLTAILIVLFVGSCICLVIAGCSDNFYIKNKVEATTQAEVTSAAVETEPITEQTDVAGETTEPSSSTAPATMPNPDGGLYVSSGYVAVSAVDLDGNNVNLSEYFGSGYAAYGGVITFESGRFAIDMGVSSRGSSNVGVYQVLSDTEMQFNFDNSDITVAEIEVVSGTLFAIRMPMDDIVVTFEMAA